MKTIYIQNEKEKELVKLYTRDIQDAMYLARELLKSGFYYVQIGPANALSSGVCVKVWDGQNHESEGD